MSQTQLFDTVFVLSNEALLALTLLLPMAGLFALLVWQRPTYFEAVGLLLGVLLHIPYLILLNIAAAYVGWWDYAPSQNSYYGMPIELILGWAVFWGAFLPYAFKSLPVFVPVVFAMTLDVFLMPQLDGLFILGDHWLIGEAVFVTVCLLPSIVIFKLTAQQKYVAARASIQSVIWGGWVVFLIPAALLSYEGKDIFDIFSWSTPRHLLFFAAMGVSAVIGYLALWEFATKGNGTPIPFDPPQKLVTTGIYAYVANPLQVSTLLMLFWIMIFYQSPLMITALLAHVIYCEIFVRWHQEMDIAERFGEDWQAYKSQVKNWVPTFKTSQI